MLSTLLSVAGYLRLSLDRLLADLDACAFVRNAREYRGTDDATVELVCVSFCLSLCMRLRAVVGRCWRLRDDIEDMIRIARQPVLHLSVCCVRARIQITAERMCRVP